LHKIKIVVKIVLCASQDIQTMNKNTVVR